MKKLTKPALYGFIFGAVVLPFIVTLGLVIPYVELLKPLLTIGKWASEPFLERVSSDTFRMPLVGVAVYLIVNGLLYATVFSGVHYMYKSRV